MTTPLEARNCVRETFYPLWRDRVQVPDVLGYNPKIFWDQLDERQLAGKGLPPQDRVWANFFMVHDNGQQTSLGGTGARRFTDDATVTFRLMVPNGDGLTDTDTLVNIAKRILRNEVAAQIFTRNVRHNEIGPFHGWFQTDILAEIEYDVIL